MIFEPLHDSNQKGEFYGAMCHWHLRRDGQITIREIIIEQDYQGNGQGKVFLERLKKVSGAISIFAKCPIDLPANNWYSAQGFELEGIETTSSGRQLKSWRLKL
jgi:N-acetylglutamate synthase-like GNAT family acetyltransferase